MRPARGRTTERRADHAHSAERPTARGTGRDGAPTARAGWGGQASTGANGEKEEGAASGARGVLILPWAAGSET